MEKQSKGQEPKSSTGQKTLGTNAENYASFLIGSIVEKGISDDPLKKPAPIPLPKPTVLPFPIARHRSHGPHWGPIGSKSGDHENDDSESNDEDDEDKNFAQFGAMADFANPVHKKKKKGLDFSRWKEHVQGDNSSMAKKSDENMLHSSKTKRKVKGVEVSEALGKRNSSFAGEDMVTSMEIDEELHLESRSLNEPKEAKTSTSEGKHNSFERMSDNNFGSLDMPRRMEQNLSSTTVSCSSSNNYRDEQKSMSLESQIDAENRARLEQMSAEEIAQSQAEMMEKMDPTLLRVLQRRGQEKLKKNNCSISEEGVSRESCNLQVENIEDEKSALQTENDVSHMETTPPLEYTESKLENDRKMEHAVSPANSSLWNVWSNRVEAVRELRFSLDGDVVENDFVQGSMNGDNSTHRKVADNVTERDYLRTEGDPSAAGYTIKEAVALTRSVVPGQRALALHLLSSVLDKALQNICQYQVGFTLRNENKVDRSVDWEAIWAFALGPEPELALALRICLDDNHNSVVLACVKVIQCVLSCDVNENFFDISEKLATFDKDICTAPVFRSKPEIDAGFLPGRFWKYNAKSSNILPPSEDILDDETEGKHTIQDDIVVAGQDFASGLVRMDSLVRLRYLLETDPTAALEECIILVLLALARHSPFCANAIMKCERLIQTIVHRFTVNNMEIQSSMIKSISLFKVLARSDKKNCLEFVKNGYFQAMTWHLYQSPSSVDHWVKSGKEKCKLSSALIVEQLRFWKVCIQYGYCVTYFSDLFPALCLWLNPPTFEKLIVNNILSEFASISGEAYLVLEALARRLPNFFSQKHLSDLSPKCTSDDKEIWSWSYVTPMVDLAAKWIATKGDPHVSKFFKGQEGVKGDFAFQNLSSTSLLWLYSAVMYMLFRVLERLTPDDTVSLHETGELVPWLPEFVPKIGLELIKYRFLGSLVSSGTESGKDSAGGASFIQELTYLRQQSDYETSVASVCCLSGLIKIIITMDILIQSAKTGISGLPFPEHSLSREGKMLRDGILSGSVVELKVVLNVFINLVASEWQCVQSIEMFGRGGPAPGVGIGWGASGGGFWSKAVLLAQTDAEFLIHMLEAFHKASSYISPSEETTFNTQRINSSLGLCLTAGPRDRVVVDKALDILFHVSVLKYLDLCIRQFLLERRNKTFGWQFKEEDYLLFSKILVSHFRSRWLSVKAKSKATDGNSSAGNKTFNKVNVPLNTIYEEVDVSTICNQDCTSLTVEWAYQRLPLPIHFYLSPISTICDSKWTGLPKDNTPIVLLEVAKSGLFFLLGIETMSNYQVTDAPSPVQSVPLIWKLHSLSVSFLAGMEVLEEEKSRGIFEALQDLYGELLDKERSSIWEEYILGDRVELTPETENKTSVEFLRFQSEIHESYSMFIEGLVEQFSAISYGDLIFGRQVAFYLHRCVESPIRLAAWNALSNAHVLDILPPLDKCFSEAGGYLEPVEDNDGLLEAYVKSWVAGALDKAAIRGSVSYTLVIHHVSSFMFDCCLMDKLSLRNKLAKSLLRDYSRKQQREGMFLHLIHYNKPSTPHINKRQDGSCLEKSRVDSRLNVLIEACNGNSSLLAEVEKLKVSLDRVTL